MFWTSEARNWYHGPLGIAYARSRAVFSAAARSYGIDLEEEDQAQDDEDAVPQQPAEHDRHLPAAGRRHSSARRTGRPTTSSTS